MDRLIEAKNRLTQPTNYFGPMINYVTTLAVAVGVDAGVISGWALKTLTPTLELQRLGLPLNEFTFWVPAKIGLITGLAAFAGKTMAIALEKPKAEKQPDKNSINPRRRFIKTAVGFFTALALGKFISSDEVENLPNSLSARQFESDTPAVPEAIIPRAAASLSEKLTSIPNLDREIKNRLDAFARNESGLDAFLRFAASSAREKQKPDQSFIDYFRDDFLPKLVDTATTAGIHPYTLATLVHYAFRANPSALGQNLDVAQEDLRLIFGGLNSVAKRHLPRQAKDLFSLAQFLAFPIKGIYGPGRTGAMNLIRENNEPSIGWQDIEVTKVSRGILAFLDIKSNDPKLLKKQKRLREDFPETLAAANHLEKAWQNFEQQRSITAMAIERLAAATENLPFIKELLSEQPNWQGWEDLGFKRENVPWQTTHLTQTFKYYVELELGGRSNPEEIGLDAMVAAVRYFVQTAKESGRQEALLRLLSSQFEDEIFWQVLTNKLPEAKDAILHVAQQGKKLQRLGQHKRNAVSLAYADLSRQENNSDWQIIAMIGLGAHFIETMNRYPRLKSLAAAEPLWQLYCVMMAREMAPANLYVNRDKYPLVTDIDLPIADPDDLYRRLDKLAGYLQKKLNQPDALNLLTAIINYEPRGSAPEDDLHRDLYWGLAWSGVKAANMELDLILNGA